MNYIPGLRIGGTGGGDGTVSSSNVDLKLQHGVEED